MDLSERLDRVEGKIQTYLNECIAAQEETKLELQNKRSEIQILQSELEILKVKVLELQERRYTEACSGEVLTMNRNKDRNGGADRREVLSNPSANDAIY